MQKVKFYTLGCKVNQYETQAIREQFISAGFREINNGSRVDVCVINTCTVTHRADADSLNYIRRAKRENPSAGIVATGCLTELDEEKIKKIDSGILIVKNKNKGEIAQILSLRYPRPREFTSPRTITGVSNFSGHTRAFLKIQDGCDNFCSYCKVPLVRGKSRSRPKKEIIAEANNLVGNGFQEIVLCGICLGAYGKDSSPKSSLVEVIEALERIDGLLRIRLSSIEAGDVSRALIDKMAQPGKLCRHLHIPVQSGDDGVLKKMNRRYCRKAYLDLVKEIRSRIPEIAITIDILVGFPGESEAGFLNSVTLIKEIMPLKTHIFPYSRREKTSAADIQAEVSTQVVKRRKAYLQKVALACTLNFKKQFLGRQLDVLIEGKSADGICLWQGHTDNYLKVGVASLRRLENKMVKVSLKKIKGELILAKF